MDVFYSNIKRWYLEMDKQSLMISLQYPQNTSVLKFTGDMNEYRRLNRMIGEDLGWVDRQIMPDDELESILKNDSIKIYILYQGKEVVGYTEIDFRNKDTAVLEYFGLIPRVRGKGLGKFLLQWTIDEVWKHSPQKFKLTTSEKDHPNALRNYLQAGFKIIDEKIEKQAILENNKI